MLTPSADHLFDRGFITFEDNGGLIVSPVADLRLLKRMGVDPAVLPRPTALNVDQKHFMEHHRREIFLSATE